MTKALARAKREDRKQMRAMDDDEFKEKVVAFVAGTGGGEGVNVGTNYVSAKWMTTIREKYQGAVIRRTAYSVDYKGESITGLEPYDEHKIMVELHEHEYEALEKLAETAVDSETFVRRFASEVSERRGWSLRARLTRATRRRGTEFLFGHTEDAAAPVVRRDEGQRHQQGDDEEDRREDVRGVPRGAVGEARPPGGHPSVPLGGGRCSGFEPGGDLRTVAAIPARGTLRAAATKAIA